MIGELKSGSNPYKNISLSDNIFFITQAFCLHFLNVHDYLIHFMETLPLIPQIGCPQRHCKNFNPPKYFPQNISSFYGFIESKFQNYAITSDICWKYFWSILKSIYFTINWHEANKREIIWFGVIFFHFYLLWLMRF